MWKLSVVVYGYFLELPIRERRQLIKSKAVVSEAKRRAKFLIPKVGNKCNPRTNLTCNIYNCVSMIYGNQYFRIVYSVQLLIES